MEKFRVLLIAAFLLCLTATSGWSAGAYVTDSFEVTLRSGPSAANRVMSTLSSGQAVKVIESQGDWSQVRLSRRDGGDVEGWMLSRYLITRMPWEVQANTAKEHSAAFKEKLTRVEQERNDFKQREAELSGRLQAATAALEKLQGQYDSLHKGAAEYLTLKKSFEAANSVLESNQSTLEALTGENRELKASQRDKWLLSGAAILLCGLMIGLLMGRQKRRRSLYP